MNANAQNGHSILLVTGNRDLAHVFQIVGRALGADVDRAPDARSAIGRLRTRQYAGIICDFELPDMNGGSLFFEIRRRRGFPPTLPDCVLLTDDADVAQPWKEFVPASIAEHRGVCDIAALIEGLLQRPGRGAASGPGRTAPRTATARAQRRAAGRSAARRRAKRRVYIGHYHPFTAPASA